jgi:predicted dehydrogenase
MEKYRVALLGCGVRSKAHINGLLENSDRFEVVGLCDLYEEKMQFIADKYDLDVPFFQDGEEMLKTTQPDVFVFLTLPDIRLSMVELGVKYGVKGISLEKPMAESLLEAKKMRDLCESQGIKAVVSHQQKYTLQMQALKKRIDDGEIGDIFTIHAECQPWIAQLGTHYIDYSLWANDGKPANWVVGHVHGRHTLSDSHPSPDYLLGEMELENGVRSYLECGYLSRQYREDKYADVDNRLTVIGTEGYVWAETDGKWGAFTKATGGELVLGEEDGWYDQEPHIQVPYYTEYADWLDDDEKVHSCNIDISYKGYEILEGMCISALEHRRVDLPISDLNYEPVIDRMREVLPDIETKKRVLYDGKEPRA